MFRISRPKRVCFHCLDFLSQKKHKIFFESEKSKFLCIKRMPRNYQEEAVLDEPIRRKNLTDSQLIIALEKLWFRNKNKKIKFEKISSFFENIPLPNFAQPRFRLSQLMFRFIDLRFDFLDLFFDFLDQKVDVLRLCSRYVSTFSTSSTIELHE